MQRVTCFLYYQGSFVCNTEYHLSPHELPSSNSLMTQDLRTLWALVFLLGFSYYQVCGQFCEGGWFSRHCVVFPTQGGRGVRSTS